MKEKIARIVFDSKIEDPVELELVENACLKLEEAGFVVETVAEDHILPRPPKKK